MVELSIQPSNVLSDVSTAIQNPIVAGGLGVIAGGAAGLGVAAIVNASKKRKKRKSKAVRKRTSKTRRSRRRKSSYARTAGKRKDTSHRRIRQTKNGQPYIILASGKARFISKKTAGLSRKRKGGKY